MSLLEKTLVIQNEIHVFLFLKRHVYDQLLENKTIIQKEEPIPPTVPMDYDWARVNQL